mgnify:CR=1 FL=1
MTGKTDDIKNYVLKWSQTKEFLKKLEDMVDFLLPNYIEEGKSQLVISIGCTGGKHRSVTVAEELYDYLVKTNRRAVVNHRDIEKDNRNN